MNRKYIMNYINFLLSILGENLLDVIAAVKTHDFHGGGHERIVEHLFNALPSSSPSISGASLSLAAAMSFSKGWIALREARGSPSFWRSSSRQFHEPVDPVDQRQGQVRDGQGNRLDRNIAKGWSTAAAFDAVLASPALPTVSLSMALKSALGFAVSLRLFRPGCLGWMWEVSLIFIVLSL